MSSIGTDKPLHQVSEKLDTFLNQGCKPQKRSVHRTNDVSDILGAQPQLKGYTYMNKEHFHNSSDISGAKSMRLHPITRNIGSNPQFQQLPIEGSTPTPETGFKTNRNVNPLTPNYTLPSYTPVPELQPKFLYDGFDVSDIQGTKYVPRVIKAPRDPLKVDDLPGAQAEYVHLKRNSRPPRNILDVSDITNVDFKTSRETDVLSPVYKIHGMQIQDTQFVHPLPRHPHRNKPKYALMTEDILAHVSKRVVCGIPNDMRRSYRETNATQDIAGAQANTAHYSICTTNRRVDPNAPSYVMLDGMRMTSAVENRKFYTSRHVDPNVPAYPALDGVGLVDATAISVGKNIIYSNLVEEQDRVLGTKMKAQLAAEMQAPFVVSGIGNVGAGSSSNPRLVMYRKLQARIKNRNNNQSTRTEVLIPASNNNLSINQSYKSDTKSRHTNVEEKALAAQLSHDIQLVKDLP